MLILRCAQDAEVDKSSDEGHQSLSNSGSVVAVSDGQPIDSVLPLVFRLCSQSINTAGIHGHEDDAPFTAVSIVDVSLAIISVRLHFA